MSKLPSKIRPRTKVNMSKRFYRLKRRYGYYDIGAVIQPQPNVADMLMKRDIIEEVNPPAEDISQKDISVDAADKPKVEPTPPKRPRGRPRKKPEA